MTVDDLNRPLFVVALTSLQPLVRVAPGRSLEMTNVPTAYGPANVTWRTRYADEGFSSPVPRELWTELRGRAPDLDSALAGFEEVGRGLSPILSLAANAAIEDPQVEVAYDVTAGSDRHAFFQAMRPVDTSEPRAMRVLPADLVPPLVNAIFGSPHGERLHRAAVHYGESLKAWSPGTQLRCVIHLWIAVEALTKVAIRVACTRAAVDEDGLMALWGVGRKELQAEARRQLIFHGDTDTCSNLRDLSDALEHSFETLGSLHAPAEEVRERSARHIRRAIMELAEVDPQVIDGLTLPPLGVPKESFAMRRILRGDLTGAPGSLAAEGQPHPFVLFESSVRDFSENEDGSYRVTPSDSYAVMLGPGVGLENIAVELRGPAPAIDGARLAAGPLDGSAEQDVNRQFAAGSLRPRSDRHGHTVG